MLAFGSSTSLISRFRRRSSLCCCSSRSKMHSTLSPSSPTIITLKPIEPTPESFAPFGQVISASSDRDKFGPQDAQLELHRGVPSCGHCGYALNLSSSDRDTANIGAGYGKSIRKGVVSFAAIDESRFTHADELLCLPFFRSPRSWGLRRRQTRLLCRGCGHLIGTYDNGSDAVSSPSGGSSSESNDAENTSGSFRQYKIRIRTLQPSDDDAGTPFEEDVLPRPSLLK